MAHLFILGLGYSAKRIRAAAEARGWRVTSTGRDGDFAFMDDAAVGAALSEASHVLSSIPPEPNIDPVLDRYGVPLAGFVHRGGWTGYLSSTGVYGDTGGAWVDESAPIGSGRRASRAFFESDWLDLGAWIFRLPGIYGPGRSSFDRIRRGEAHRIDLPGQVFSRIHVEDLAAGVIAGLTAPAGIYNLADDLPTSQSVVVEEACRLLGVEPPPLRSLDDAGLSPQARAFYGESRRVANGKAKRVLDWTPRFPTYREGLRAILRPTSP